MCTYHREGRRTKFNKMICFHFYDDAKYPVTELEMWGHKAQLINDAVAGFRLAMFSWINTSSRVSSRGKLP